MRWRDSLACIGLLLAGCSRGDDGAANRTVYGTYDENGTASWYGEELDGNLTASGEEFEPGGVTVAHRTLPLNSFVEVTSVETGRSILARVNDRGPGREDRIIDLSRGAAQLLGNHHGLWPVRVRAVVKPGVMTQPTPTRTTAAAPPRLERGRRYGVQVASFSSKSRAQALAGRLGADVMAAHGVFRVRLGPMAADRVQAARDAVAVRGYGDAQVLRLD